MKRRVFWLIDDTLYCFPYDETNTNGVAKSGDTYNHQKLWEYVKPRKCRKSFDYYPRGRVEISAKEKAVIYMSIHISADYVNQICLKFEITDKPEIRYDYSRHYRCYLDGGKK